MFKKQSCRKFDFQLKTIRQIWNWTSGSSTRDWTMKREKPENQFLLYNWYLTYYKKFKIESEKIICYIISSILMKLSM